MDYLGCSFDINMQMSTVEIKWNNGSSCDALDIIPDQVKDNKVVSYSDGRISFTRGSFTIKRKIPLACPLPDGKNYVNSTGHLLAFNSMFVLTILVLSMGKIVPL
jgi:hypothetical protein